MEDNNQGATPPVTPQAVTATNPQVTPGATPTIQLDTAARIAELERDLNSANSRITDLNRENQKYRLLSKAVEGIGETPETLKDRLEADAARLAAYSAIGTPEEIVANRQSLEVDANEAKLLRLEKIADDVNWRGEVLADLANDKKFRVVSREGKDAEGKAIRIPTAVFTNGDKEEEKPLVEYVETTLPNYLPSLRKEAVAPTGTPFIRQVNGDQKPAVASFEELKRRKMQQSEYPTF